MAEFQLETNRLVMRGWRENDLDIFHAINSDPKVRKTLGPIMTRQQVADLIAWLQDYQKEHGHCYWALETKADKKLIGWCGIIRGGEETPVYDKLEIGWRMAFAQWGNGYVTEAAQKCCEWAAATFPDEQVWAITSEHNHRSRAVMERLNMKHFPELDFDHPKVDPKSDLVRHVTYCKETSK
ncbi:GNAT family N-acetyltransferase [Sphingorhabdus sp. Alg231-15]|uniref:GNAT family N-acetyltransferase n=1 Tax=Sphingorhabdus sp. Alg231-15 TaxID=1922222 RepID=UPI000D55E065